MIGDATRACLVAGSVSARRVIAEPGGFAVSVGFYIAATTVLGTLWRTAADASGGTLGGYTAAGLMWYAATSEAAIGAIETRLIEQTGDDIASGSVAVELLRPASVLAVRVAATFGRALPRLVACGASGVLLASASVGRVPDARGAALAVPSLLLAVLCNVVAQHAIAAMSFWVRDARSGWFLYQKFVFVVGGMLLPLEAMPHTLASIARVLPFMTMAYAPARLASGHVEPLLLMIQAGWLAVLALIAVGVFAAGERRLQVVGG